MLYNKDTEYNIKYITVDGDKKEITYTPEKDMSVPEIITMLKNKDKDFFKLLKESKFDKVSKKIFNKGKQDGMTKDDADAIAASIGRKKYGKEKFQKMAQKGKKTEARRNNKQLDYKLDGFKGVIISVVDKKNGINTEEYIKFDSMNFGIDEDEFEDSMVDNIKNVLINLYEFSDVYYDDVFMSDEITEVAKDITQNVLQLYDDLPEENIENTITEIVEEYPELKDKMEDVRFYVGQKVPEVYEEKDEEDLEESKLTEDENTIIDNLYDLLEYRNFELITVEDSKYDMSADYYCQPNDSDPYQTFLVRLAKSLKINPVDIDDIRNMTTVVVNMEDWVIPNFDTMEDLFGVGGADEEDEIKGIIEFSMVALIEGNAGTWAYEELNKQAKFTESIDNGMQDLEAISVLDEDKDVEDDVPYDNTTPKKCPICGKTYTDFPALSRRDNKTYICPDCGVDEAMEDYFKAMSKQENLTEDLQGTGEDQTQTQEDVEQAVSEVKNPTEEDKFAVETANSSIDVLVADEQQAIDGYKAFLHQCEETIVPTLYDVLQKEVNEIIADEEDHINKLNTIKSAFHLEDIPLDESKQLKEDINTDNKILNKLSKQIGDSYKIPQLHVYDILWMLYKNDCLNMNNVRSMTGDIDEFLNESVQESVEDDSLTDEEIYEQKYNQVFGKMGIDIDSPQEQEDSHIVGTYIKNHPEKTVDEIIEVYRSFLEFGDNTILESKIIK